MGPTLVNRLAWATERTNSSGVERRTPQGFISFGPVFDAPQDVVGDYRQQGFDHGSSFVTVFLSYVHKVGTAQRYRPSCSYHGRLTSAILAAAYIDNARYPWAHCH